MSSSYCLGQLSHQHHYFSQPVEVLGQQGTGSRFIYGEILSLDQYFSWWHGLVNQFWDWWWEVNFYEMFGAVRICWMLDSLLSMNQFHHLSHYRMIWYEWAIPLSASMLRLQHLQICSHVSSFFWTSHSSASSCSSVSPVWSSPQNMFWGCLCSQEWFLTTGSVPWMHF